MSAWIRLLFVVILAAIAAWPSTTRAQGTSTADPLRRGHALLIGNYSYKDSRWDAVDDIELQITALRNGLQNHFDSVEVAENLDADQLLRRIQSFLRTKGNDTSARLFIYYSGHGYSEIIPELNTHRGYITGIDTPAVRSGTQLEYDAARLKAVSMFQLRELVREVVAHQVLFVFDSCFAGTIFTSRTGQGAPTRLSDQLLRQRMERPSRDFIAAGRARDKIPPDSPIPALLLSALSGAADPTKRGVVTASQIGSYLLDEVEKIPGTNFRPQHGRLPDDRFAEGEFLFRVIARPDDEPATARGFFNRATAYRAKREYDRAIEDFSAAIRLESRFTGAYVARGHSYLEKNDFDRAIADYSRAIQIDPKYAGAMTARGMAFIRKGELDRGIDELTRALALEPTQPVALWQRAQAYNSLGKKDLAIADLTEAIKLNPEFYLALGSRGHFYYEKKDYVRAISDFSAAISANSEYLVAPALRGKIYYDTKDYNRALTDFNEAIRIHEKSGVGSYYPGIAYYYRGQIKMARGDGSGGEADVTKGKQLYPAVGQ